jgi:hypothetical protein
MRHILKIVLAVVLALTPIAANAKTRSSSHSKTTATKTTRTRTPKAKVDSRKKTQHVSGYTTKKGTKVAPYKRRPAN